VVITEPFAGKTRLEAEAWGVGWLPLISLPHPVAPLTRAEASPVFRATIREVVAALTDPAAVVQEGYRRDAPARPSGDDGSKPMLIDVPDDPGTFFTEMVERGWSDGLPLIPPTPERVEAMLAATSYEPAHSLGIFPPYGCEATVELVAVNAVMAGCLPDHFPFVVAAIDAVLAPDYDMMAVQTTTNSATPLIVINGPVRDRLEFNGAGNALGQGWRGNATVGRALRLCMVNIGGAAPGVRDKATLGQPGKYTLCLRENEEQSPWEPFHVEQGFPKDSNTVSVFTVTGTQAILDGCSKSAESLLQTFARSAAYPGMQNIQIGGGPVFVLGVQHARIFADAGYTKQVLKERLFEAGRVDVSEFSPDIVHYNLHRYRPPEAWDDSGERLSFADSPDLIKVIVAGDEGGHSMFMPRMGSGVRARSTRVVDAGSLER
jgi:hypothetical protein